MNPGLKALITRFADPALIHVCHCGTQAADGNKSDLIQKFKELWDATQCHKLDIL